MGGNGASQVSLLHSSLEESHVGEGQSLNPIILPVIHLLDVHAPPQPHLLMGVDMQLHCPGSLCPAWAFAITSQTMRQHGPTAGPFLSLCINLMAADTTFPRPGQFTLSDPQAFLGPNLPQEFFGVLPALGNWRQVTCH